MCNGSGAPSVATMFVHLGPPKTGTTALQIALQRQYLHGVYYGGTHQPRRASQDLSARLHELVKGVVQNDDPHITATRHDIDAILAAGRNNSRRQATGCTHQPASSLRRPALSLSGGISCIEFPPENAVRGVLEFGVCSLLSI